jgi:hypothetical protein
MCTPCELTVIPNRDAISERRFESTAKNNDTVTITIIVSPIIVFLSITRYSKLNYFVLNYLLCSQNTKNKDIHQLFHKKTAFQE